MLNDVTIVGETGYIRTSRPCQCPEGFTIVTRQGDEPDPMLLRGKAVTPRPSAPLPLSPTRRCCAARRRHHTRSSALALTPALTHVDTHTHTHTHTHARTHKRARARTRACPGDNAPAARPTAARPRSRLQLRGLAGLRVRGHRRAGGHRAGAHRAPRDANVRDARDGARLRRDTRADRPQVSVGRGGDGRRVRTTTSECSSSGARCRWPGYRGV